MNLLVDIPTTAMEEGEGEEELCLSGMEMKPGAGLQALQDDELFFVHEGPHSTDVIPTRGILRGRVSSLRGFIPCPGGLLVIRIRRR